MPTGPSGPRETLSVGSSSRTVELWLKSVDGASHTVFVYGWNANHRLWEMMQGGGVLNLHFYGGGALLNGAIPPNVWHHAALTYSDKGTGLGTVQLYIDGVLTGVQDIESLNTAWEYVRIGGPGYGPTWQGSVDEVAVYDYVLSADVIAQHYRLATHPLTVVF